jgi:hypothetical protein
MPHPVPAAAMVLMILVALGVGVEHWRRPTLPPLSEHERMVGEKARAQMVLALKITGAQLSRMQQLLSHPSNGRVADNQINQTGSGH